MSLPAIFLIFMGILCILYGIMVFLIRSGTLFFAVWLAAGSCLLLLGLLTQIRFWSHLPKIANTLLLLAAAAAILMLIICVGFVLKGFASNAPAGLDYLIVLGAQVRDDGPSAVLKYRLDAAAQYMRDNDSVICIVTGGKGSYEPVAEGTAMKQYLLKQGIESERILVEDQARNTVQNIQLSKPLLASPNDSVGIVTNNFHVTRAMALARKQGLTNVYAISAPSDPLFLPNNMFREFFGLTKDYLKGNL